MSRIRHFSSGVTVVELIVVMVVMGILLTYFAAVLTSLYGESFIVKARSQADSTLQAAFDIIEKDIRYSVAFKHSNQAPFVDTFGMSTTEGANYTWSYSGSGAESRVLLLSSNAINQRSSSTIRRPVYARTTSYNCAEQMVYQPNIQYMTIYFVRDSVLYRRILTDVTTDRCPGQTMAQLQSCPAVAVEGGLGAGSLCKARDEAIAQNVTALKVDYYDSNGDALENQYIPGHKDSVDGATGVNVTIKIAPNSEVERSRSMRITRVN